MTTLAVPICNLCHTTPAAREWKITTDRSGATLVRLLKLCLDCASVYRESAQTVEMTEATT